MNSWPGKMAPAVVFYVLITWFGWRSIVVLERPRYQNFKNTARLPVLKLDSGEFRVRASGFWLNDAQDYWYERQFWEWNVIPERLSEEGE